MAKYIFKTGICPLNDEDSCHGENEYIFWEHDDCGGRGFVNVNAEVECEDCHVIVRIEDLLFRCPNHTFYRTNYKASAQKTIWNFASNFAANIDPPNDFYVQKMKYNLEKRIGPEK